MRRIKALNTMKIADDWGYLIAVCEDSTVWTRAFPVDDQWHQVDGIMDDDELYIATRETRARVVNAD